MVKSLGVYDVGRISFQFPCSECEPPLRRNSAPFEILLGQLPLLQLSLGRGSVGQMYALSSHYWPYRYQGPAPCGTSLWQCASHLYALDDLVWVRWHQTATHKPQWRGPYYMILTTSTTPKVDVIKTWAHASHEKPACLPHWRQNDMDQ